ncbi:MAG TPA: redoxin domain-containing protein [Actinomycetota bacterium]|nr:redoxin domain-containing protein [Actinomycetota bacterium]
MRRLAVLSLVFALAGCTVRGDDVSGPGSARPVRLQPGKVVEAKPASFRATIAALKGTPVVVNFWASWCAPCKAEMPRFVAASKAYDGRVEFLGVDSRDDPDAAARFIEEYSVPFASFGDARGDILVERKGSGLPMTLFFRDDGRLAFKDHGEVDEDKLESRITELLRVRRSDVAPSVSPGPRG